MGYVCWNGSRTTGGSNHATAAASVSGSRWAEAPTGRYWICVTKVSAGHDSTRNNWANEPLTDHLSVEGQGRVAYGPLRRRPRRAVTRGGQVTIATVRVERRAAGPVI